MSVYYSYSDNYRINFNREGVAMNFWSTIFPIVIIGLSFWAGVMYAFAKVPLHSMYWFCAAALNTCVLFMGE